MGKKSDETIIELKKDQVALVMSENDFTVYIPDQDEEGDVPDHTIFLTTIAILLQIEDKEFQEYIARKAGELLKDVETP